MGPAASACELRRAGRRSQAPLASQGVSLEFSYLCCVLVAPCDVCRPILITYEYTSLPPLRQHLLATQNPRRQRRRRPNFSMSTLPTVEISLFSYFSKKCVGGGVDVLSMSALAKIEFRIPRRWRGCVLVLSMPAEPILFQYLSFAIISKRVAGLSVRPSRPSARSETSVGPSRLVSSPVVPLARSPAQEHLWVRPSLRPFVRPSSFAPIRTCT